MAIIASFSFGKGEKDENAKKEYTMKQLIQILTEKGDDGSCKKLRSRINRSIFRKIIKEKEDELVLGNRKIG